MSFLKNLYNILLLILFVNLVICQLEEETNTLNDYEDEDETSNNEKGEYLKNLDYSNIIILNDTNYTDVIKQYDEIYLLIYAYWCIHCERFMPEYIEAANYFADQKSELKFAIIDGYINRGVSNEYEIEGFPTVFLYVNKVKYEYTASNSKEGVINFYKKTKNGPISYVNSVEAIERMFKKVEKLLISTIVDKSLSVYKSFQNFSMDNGELEVISCISDECIKKYGKDDIILLKHFDEEEIYYSKNYGAVSKADEESLSEFYAIYGIECGGPFQEKQADFLYDNNRKAIFYFRNSKDENQTSYDITIKNLGKQLRFKKIYTFVLDIVGDQYNVEAGGYFSVSKEELPTLMYYDINSDDSEKSYTYRIKNINNNQLKNEYIINFIEDIKNGKIKRDLRTGENEIAEEIKGLKRVYGKTYDEDVVEETKNVCILLVNEESENKNYTKYIDIISNISLKYQNSAKYGKDIVFEIMNIALNEPRDIELNEDEQVAYIYLYTNSMKDKKIIKFIPKKNDAISQDEVEKFICDNLGWKIENLKENENKNNKYNKNSGDNKTDL